MFEQPTPNTAGGEKGRWNEETNQGLRKLQVGVEKLSELNRAIRAVINQKSIDGVLDITNQFLHCDLDASLGPNFYSRVKETFAEDFSLEIPPEDAGFFSSKLFNLLEREYRCETYHDFFVSLADAYMRIVEPWIPIFYCFVHTVMDFTRDYDVDAIYIIARDALHFYPIALALEKRGICRKKVKLVNLSRNMFSDMDNWIQSFCYQKGSCSSPSLQKTEKKYVEKFFNDKVSLAYLDTGAYGTNIRYLLNEERASHTPVFYFYSRNPNIFGYCNFLVLDLRMRGYSVPNDFVILMGDTAEAILKPYRNSVPTTIGGKVDVVAELSSPTSVMCAMATYWKLYLASLELEFYSIDACQQLVKLYDTYHRMLNGQLHIPFILPKCIPRWKHARYWCKAWDLGPIPPMDRICGPECG